MFEHNQLPNFEQAVLPHLDAAYNLPRWLMRNEQDAQDFDENLFPADSRAPNPEEVVLQNDSVTLVRKALEKLPPNFREVLVLRELEGISYREIAAITGMPAGTVMSSLSRARGRLRQVLTI